MMISFPRQSQSGGSSFVVLPRHWMGCRQERWWMHQESPAGSNSNRPLVLVSNICQPCVICSLVVKKWHGFCHARICRFSDSPRHGIPPTVHLNSEL